MSITHVDLLAALHYDPETGIWTRLQASPPNRIGARADKSAGHNYRRISVKGKRYFAHRLAWFYMTGVWPIIDVDHKDTDKQNNKWNNYRLATRQQNIANKKRSRVNKSGVKGVYWNKGAKCWTVQVGLNGKSTHVGHFKDLELARLTYNNKVKELFGEFARHD